MSPTMRLRFVYRVSEHQYVLQQWWEQKHIPAGQSKAVGEWRDVAFEGEV